MKTGWFARLVRQRLIAVLILLVQLIFFFWFVLNGIWRYPYLGVALSAISFAVSLYIANSHKEGAFKLAWVYLILIVPIFGGIIYLAAKLQSEVRRFKGADSFLDTQVRPLFMLDGSVMDAAAGLNPGRKLQMSYLEHFIGFPVCPGGEERYYPWGRLFFNAVLEELEKAEKYIFLEFFIIQEGVMWNSILEILARKASQGVEVRIMYDDIGCFLLLPSDYIQKLAAMGIKAQIFNPLKAVAAVSLNNRDHRKIISIDGLTAFTGGINLADEYINAVEKYGVWKDSGIMLRGRGAWTLTLLFLQMWELGRGSRHSKASAYASCPDLQSYYPHYPEPVLSKGFVQPYGDSPMDDEHVGKHVYMHLISSAVKYIYITTPYLILDDGMTSALILAAKGGVDVRIITPHKWDKKLVHITTRSYYRDLLKGGVKIYEFTEGFIHAKTIVCDDSAAVVGTTNFDFRSLYLHFECGTVLYNVPAVMQVKEDFLDTVKRCTPITLGDCRTNIVAEFMQDVLRLFAPLM